MLILEKLCIDNEWINRIDDIDKIYLFHMQRDELSDSDNAESDVDGFNSDGSDYKPTSKSRKQTPGKVKFLLIRNPYNTNFLCKSICKAGR